MYLINTASKYYRKCYLSCMMNAAAESGTPSPPNLKLGKHSYYGKPHVPAKIMSYTVSLIFILCIQFCPELINFV